ncbi:hypothetical protein EDB89DRAFT_1219461 [Lactarius sanguifluus]|nr:hypothetical protein EDB89DRAFT_1219461 [Lactarius sanguifluus]
MANRTADELLATISVPVPQENDDLLSSAQRRPMCCRRSTLTSTCRALVAPQPGVDLVLGEPREPKPNAVVLRHDPIACLDGRAIPAAAGSDKVPGAVRASPWRGERGLAPGRRQLEGPAGGLAARVADLQLRLFVQASSHVTGSSALLPSSSSSPHEPVRLQLSSRRWRDARARRAAMPIGLSSLAARSRPTEPSLSTCTFIVPLSPSRVEF